MEMIGHHDKFMEQVFPLEPIVQKHIDKRGEKIVPLEINIVSEMRKQ